MRFVLDCSASVAWCLDDECDAWADAVLDSLVQGGAVVPALWPFEMANVLAIAERRGRVPRAQVAHILALLGSLPIMVDPGPPAPLMAALDSLAREHRLTAYDAASLELGLRHGVPIATRDVELRRAARDAGGSLV